MSIRSTRGKLLASAAVIAALGASLTMVFSAFTSVTASEANTFSAGSLTLTDNDAGTALFSLQGLTPGDAATRCLRVDLDTTEGLTSTVKLYGSTVDAARPLSPYLHVTITRGRDAAPAGTTAAQKLGCTGFAADAGAPLYDGTLEDFPDGEAAAIADPDGTWTDGDHAVYRISATLEDTDAAQGGDVEQELVFRAQADS